MRWLMISKAMETGWMQDPGWHRPKREPKPPRTPLGGDGSEFQRVHRHFFQLFYDKRKLV